jgi:hypothetical protein
LEVKLNQAFKYFLISTSLLLFISGGTKPLFSEVIQTNSVLSSSYFAETNGYFIEKETVNDKINTLFPNWTLIKKQQLSFDSNSKDYTLLFLQHDKVKEHDEGTIKLAVVQYGSPDQKWVTVWDSEEHDTFLIFDYEHNIGEITITKRSKPSTTPCVC